MDDSRYDRLREVLELLLARRISVECVGMSGEVWVECCVCLAHFAEVSQVMSSEYEYDESNRGGGKRHSLSHIGHDGRSVGVRVRKRKLQVKSVCLRGSHGASALRMELGGCLPVACRYSCEAASGVAQRK